MFNNSIQYVFETGSGNIRASLTPAEEGKPDSTSIALWTNDLNTFKSEPVCINFIFSEGTPRVEKLKSIRVSLYTKNDKAEFSELSSNAEVNMEYFDGKRIVQISKKGDTEPLNTLIDWKEVNYEYEFNGVKYSKQNNPVTYSGSFKYDLKKYPDTLYLSVKLIWEKEEMKIEKVLNKIKYKSPKLNPKF